MFKRFLKRLLIIILVAVTGFAAGYFSEKVIPAEKLTRYLDNLRDANEQPAATENSNPEGSGRQQSDPAGVETAGTETANPSAVVSQAPPIGAEDLMLDGLKIGDKRSQVEENLGQGVKVRKSVDPVTGENIRTFDNDRLTVEWSKKNGVFAITTSSPEITTNRGLQVGDPVEKVYRLYGRPATEQSGMAAYQYPESGEEVFFIKYEDKKVTEIKVTMKKSS